MDASLNDQLYERYPAIFREHTLSADVTSMCWGIQTGNGWYVLIDELCAGLQRESDCSGAPQVVATEVKEKFGTLRFHVHEASVRQQALIDAAGERSGRTCEVCGAPGSQVEVARRRRAPRCSAHAR